MTGSELAAISRLLKYGEKAVKELINNKEEQHENNYNNDGIKQDKQKRKELYSNHMTIFQINRLRKKIDLMLEIEKRDTENGIIVISNEEIEKLIVMCEHLTIADTFLRYLLMIFAAKSRGMVHYVKQISETRTYIDMFFPDVIDDSILNEKDIYIISLAIRAWMPLAIDNNLKIWNKYQEEKQQIKEEKERIKDEKRKEKERRKENRKLPDEVLGAQETLFFNEKMKKKFEEKKEKEKNDINLNTLEMFVILAAFIIIAIGLVCK